MFRKGFGSLFTNTRLNSFIIKHKQTPISLLEVGGAFVIIDPQRVVLNSFRRKISTQNGILKKMTEQTSEAVPNVFVGSLDMYKGVHVKSKEEPCDSALLNIKIEGSLKHWKTEKVRAAWFYVSHEDSAWVPILTKNGFRYHHVREECVAMVQWLADEESRIPVFAHTMIGAGAVVVDSKGRLLVVQEKYRNILYWKLPGGYVEPGENISDAAMREVLEETNIKTEFRNMIGFRHSSSGAFGCSDIYFVVELAPLTSDIVKDDLEVEDCEWMEIDTFLNHPNVHEHNRFVLRKYLFSKESGISINGIKTVHPITKRPQMLYILGPRNDLVVEHS